MKTLKWACTILIYSACLFSYCQNSSVNSLTIPLLRTPYVLGKSDSMQVIAYENYTTKIYYNNYNKSGIDTILTVIDGADTLNRFYDSELNNFMELIEKTNTIPDYKLLFRIFEMYADPRIREKEIRHLPHTFKTLSIHLYGVFSEGFAIVKSNGKFGYINREGYLVFDCIFENASGFKNGKALVKYLGNWYQLDYFGQLTGYN